MILKIFKAVWFLSLIAVLAILMYVYASLPQDISMVWGKKTLITTKTMIFYDSLFIIAIVNVLVFIVSKLFGKTRTDFTAWFYGQVATLNFFFLIALCFINLVNSSEKFNFGVIGPIIYGSILLVIGWAIGWPVYWLIKRFSGKPAV